MKGRCNRIKYQHSFPEKTRWVYPKSNPFLMYLYKMSKLEAPPVLGEFHSTRCPLLSADRAQGKSWHRKPNGN